MKVEKDKIVKDVADNVVSDYISAGWKMCEETTKNAKSKSNAKEVKEKLSGFDSTNELKEEKVEDGE